MTVMQMDGQGTDAPDLARIDVDASMCPDVSGLGVWHVQPYS